MNNENVNIDNNDTISLKVDDLITAVLIIFHEYRSKIALPLVVAFHSYFLVR